ncbi:unnamed protein product [Zymoseptoria tritici ST99CH_1E4]|uniref:Uncharacterized protein n=1 Tax=Zymoseptoria tritici ST99CH_1E4 TaxID=1276532 RepID=A0A2H1GP53_ZYMTR|nr:unnamed protein product [Zymoseptoria tritici ST99CH_1E4]
MDILLVATTILGAVHGGELVTKDYLACKGIPSSTADQLCRGAQGDVASKPGKSLLCASRASRKIHQKVRQGPWED